MRLTLPQLAGWSFLMSSSHGAGLMLLPVLAGLPDGDASGSAHGGHLAAAPAGALDGLAAAGVHTAAMFGTAALLALLVYEVVGLGVLRTAWFNLDRLWAGVLVTAGLITLVVAAA
jgi:hypothetical protein